MGQRQLRHHDGQPGGDAVDIEYDAWEAAEESGDWQAAAEQVRSQMISSEPVVVAVVDTGVDASNPDLAPVMWDDGLSIPELVELGGDEHGLSTYADPNATSTSGIEPTDAHGTHVAGIIAAAWDGAGTLGIAPNAEIMSVRLDFSTANAIEAFNYIAAAADAGVNVRVANCSWTVGATASRSLDLATRQMGERGVVSLFASGNNNSDMTALSTWRRCCAKTPTCSPSTPSILRATSRTSAATALRPPT